MEEGCIVYWHKLTIILNTWTSLHSFNPAATQVGTITPQPATSSQVIPIRAASLTSLLSLTISSRSQIIGIGWPLFRCPQASDPYWGSHHHNWWEPNATSLSRSCYSSPLPSSFFRIRSTAGQRWWWGLWWWPWPCLRKPPKNSFQDTISGSSPTIHTLRGPVQLTINKEMMKFPWARDKFQAGLVLVIT